MQVLPPQYKFNGLEFKMHSVQFSRSGMSDSLRPHEPQHARPPCPSPAPGVHPNPCPLSRCCHPTISSSVVPFSSCPQSFPTSWQCLNWNITDLIPLMLLDGDRWTMLHAHLRVLSYHHFFCRVASIHCKAKHADSNERNPLREIPHFSWLRSSGIPGIELWKQLIIWSGYPFMPYISQQSTNCSLIRHEETFSLFPNLFLVWGCNLIYSSLVSPSRKGERRLMLRFLSLNYHTAEWTCFCVNKRYK